MEHTLDEGGIEAARVLRFSGIIPPEVIGSTQVAVIGCGGIGSWVAMGLACLGVAIHLFDPEETEPHNYGGQPLPEIGESKVQQLIAYLGPLAREIDGTVAKFSDESARMHQGSIWVSGVDSMESRRDIWAWALKYRVGPENPAGLRWYIDGRMGGTQSHVITVDLANGEAVTRYEKTLNPENGFSQDACAMRSTVFAGMGCAAQVVSEVARILKGQAVPRQQNVEWLSGMSVEGWAQ